MANQIYITVDEVEEENSTFSRFSTETKQHYVDKANDECEDLAIRKADVSWEDIMVPIHFKLKEYLIHYTLQQFYLKNVGHNVKGQETDKYEAGFKRESYVLQKLGTEVTKSVITGVNDSRETRAVVSQKLYRA